MNAYRLNDKGFIAHDYLASQKLTFCAGVTSSTPGVDWQMGENILYQFIVKKTWYNRWKWWIAVKLFLPGTYKWRD